MYYVLRNTIEVLESIMLRLSANLGNTIRFILCWTRKSLLWSVTTSSSGSLALKRFQTQKNETGIQLILFICPVKCEKIPTKFWLCILIILDKISTFVHSQFMTKLSKSQLFVMLWKNILTSEHHFNFQMKSESSHCGKIPFSV